MGYYYLSGPMRGYPEFNFPTFIRVTETLRKGGLNIISPAEHDMEMGFDYRGSSGNIEDFNVPNYTLADAIRWDVKVITDEDCFGVICLPGWEESSGAKLEVNAAQFMSKQVFRVLENPQIAKGFDLYPITQKIGVLPENLPTSSPEPRVQDFREHIVLSEGQTRENATQALSGEVRITDPKTGGQKGQKLPQLAAIDPIALLELSKVAGFGAQKYATFNYLKGFDWQLAMDALFRHSLLFWSGQTYDEETGINHMAHAGWQALCLVSFTERQLGTDTRPWTNHSSAEK